MIRSNKYLSTYIHFVSQLLQAILRHLVVSLDHVVRLLGIEGVGNRSEHEEKANCKKLSFATRAEIFIIFC